MKNSRNAHKMVLGMHTSMEHLMAMEKELKSAYPTILFYKAATYEEGVQLMLSYTFDLVISEITGEQGAELIELASRRHFPVVIISENGQSPKDLNRVCGTQMLSVSSRQDMRAIVQNLGKTHMARNKLRLPRFMGKILTMCNVAASKLSPRTIDRRYYEIPNIPIYY